MEVRRAATIGAFVLVAVIATAAELLAHASNLPGPEHDYESGPNRLLRASNGDGLREVLRNALPGDWIELEDGLYEGDFVFPERKSTGGDIVILAKSFLAANFQGRLRVVGGGYVFWGLGLGGSSITVEGDNVRLDRCLFDGFSAERGIQVDVYGADFVATRCEFRRSKGRGIVVRAAQGALRARVSRCHFRDFVGEEGENVHEPIQLGLGAKDRLVQALAVVEYNLFERVNVDAEAISVKSSANTVRFNTLVDSRVAKLSNRSGNGNFFVANWIERSGGIGVMCADSVYERNVLIDTTYGFRIFAGKCSPYDPPDNKLYPAAWNNRFVSNRADRTTLGDAFAGTEMLVAARGNTFVNHVGPVERLREEGTVLVSGEDIEREAFPFRLRSEEVGVLFEEVLRDGHEH